MPQNEGRPSTRYKPAKDAKIAARRKIVATMRANRRPWHEIAAETGAEVATGFIDQEPQVSSLTGRAGVCLPFFAAEGGHVSDDIPRALVGARRDSRRSSCSCARRRSISAMRASMGRSISSKAVRTSCAGRRSS